MVFPNIYAVPTDTSDEGRERYKQTIELVWFLVSSGYLKCEIPLNGGSEERRELIKDIKDSYEGIFGLTVEVTSFMITIRKYRDTDDPF